MSRAGDAARRVKHAGFVVRKGLRPAAITGHDAVTARLEPLRPYRFDVDRYRDPRGALPFGFFLHREAPPGWVAPQPTTVPRRIFCLWPGDNPMTDNRHRSLDGLRAANPDLDVVLVTSADVADHVVPGHPLHPAYEHLSAVHRSDYLRGYLMHHHGGGYADLKPGHGSWAAAFDRVADDPDLWLLGYPEVDSDSNANLSGPLLRDLRRHWSRLVGNAAFVARPGTPLTAEWLAEVHRRLDYHAADLARHPATDPYGADPDYPVTWIGIQANVLQPLQLKHLAHVAQDPALTPAFTDYR